MKQHPFDPLSFVFGLLFLGAGLPLLFSDSGFAIFEARWIFPGFLVLAGAVVLATTRSRLASNESVLSEMSVEADLDTMDD
ncbi:MAG: hypothetical protein U9N84_11300 [Actinomycetota bacterium]|nr:hypothetical protein [Actinomycetota bacterium]